MIPAAASSKRCAARSSSRCIASTWRSSHAEKGLIASAGNPAHHSFVRSSIKMFQALPFVEAGGVERFQLTGEELALCTASHGGEPFHVAAARSILAKGQGHRSRAGVRSAPAAARADRQRDAVAPARRPGASTTIARASMPACSRTASSSNGSRTAITAAPHPMQQRVADDADAVDAHRSPRMSRWRSTAAACRRLRLRSMPWPKAARDSPPRSPPAIRRRRRSSTRWSRIRNTSPAPIASTPT